MGKKGELTFDELIPWIIVLGTLAVILILYFTLGEKGSSLLDNLKRLARFGR